MRDLAGSAFLLVLLLPAFLAAGPPSGATPVVASEPMSGRSPAQAAKAACALPGACLAQASAGEPDEIRPVASVTPLRRRLPTMPALGGCASGSPVETARVRPAPANPPRLARRHGSPPPGRSAALLPDQPGEEIDRQIIFHRRRCCRQRPERPRWRGLANPFEPVEAINESAKLLRDLRREFGNLGLAAPCRDAPCKRRAVSADRWPFRSSAGARNPAGRSLGRAIRRKLVRRDGARCLSQISGKVRVPSWRAASHTSFTTGSHAAAWAGRGSTSGPRAARVPKNCARTCVRPARAVWCNAIEEDTVPYALLVISSRRRSTRST